VTKTESFAVAFYVLVDSSKANTDQVEWILNLEAVTFYGIIDQEFVDFGRHLY
jgi:hypothetical protein